MRTPDPREFRPLRDTRGPSQVTGEAVLLDVPAASLAARCLSGLIDLVVRVLVFALCWRSMAYLLENVDLSLAVLTGLGILITLCCFVIGPAAVETATMGRSLGKLALGLRAVRTDGGAISFRHALVRAFVGLVETLMTFGMVAFLTAAATTRSRRLGDLAAGTYVIREVRRLTLPEPPHMPAALASWASGASVLPLPTPLATQMTMLVRATPPQRNAAYDAQVSAVLTRLIPYVAPPPPPGHDPHAVLIAICVVRRDADTRLLMRDAEARRRLLGRPPVPTP